MDAWLTKENKPTFLGGVNGMICGLVGDHSMRRLGQRSGCHLRRRSSPPRRVGAWNFLSKVKPFSKVDDALGVVYTHGMAGLLGGLLLGFFADPGMIEYPVARLGAS